MVGVLATGGRGGGAEAAVWQFTSSPFWKQRELEPQSWENWVPTPICARFPEIVSPEIIQIQPEDPEPEGGTQVEHRLAKFTGPPISDSEISIFTSEITHTLAVQL